MEPTRITTDEVKQKLDAGEPIALVDTRSREAWDQSDVMARGAIRVPPDEAERHLDEVPRDPLVVTYCT